MDDQQTHGSPRIVCLRLNRRSMNRISIEPLFRLIVCLGLIGLVHSTANAGQAGSQTSPDSAAKDPSEPAWSVILKGPGTKMRAIEPNKSVLDPASDAAAIKSVSLRRDFLSRDGATVE